MNTFLSRRELLFRAGGGAGMLALAALLSDEGLLTSSANAADANNTGKATSDPKLNPLAPRVAHFPAKAKSVIWLFMNGGPSQVDTWDYKPTLEKLDGKPLEG